MQLRIRQVIAQVMAAALGLILTLSPSLSDAGEPPAAELPAAASKRWLVVLCGLPGDQLHRERLTQAVEQIAAAAEPVLLVPKERVKVLVGDATMAEEVRDQLSEVGVCTAESVSALFQSLGPQVAADDACWVICLGHAQLIGTRSTFNVQAADFDADHLARALAPIKCRQRVLMLTMPLSGFWMKPLRREETVCIAATEAAPEFTATEMPYALADILAGTQSHQSLSDIDEDGRLTLLDLYLAVNLEIYQRYKAMERLQTEHAQLDDNGDGIGKELQEAYLPQEEREDETDSIPAAKPPRRAAMTLNGDGGLARRIAVAAPRNADEPATVEPPARPDAQ